MPAIPAHHTATSDSPWADQSSRISDDQWNEAKCRALFAFFDGGDANPAVKSNYSYEHHFVNADGSIGPASSVHCSQQIGVLNGGRAGPGSMSDADRHGVWNHLAAHLRDANKGVAGYEPPPLRSQERADAPAPDESPCAACGHAPDCDCTDCDCANHNGVDQASTPRSAIPPRDNLVRASAGGIALEETSGAPVLVGHAAVFNQWTKIDSAIEGTFLERILPGAFRRTITNNQPNMRILFNHGQDPTMGDQVLAPIETLAEDKTGLAYSGHLFEGVPPLIVSGLRAGVYGSSFRFSVMKQDFNRKAAASDYNPDALPERTIQEARVMEFGPVTFPAYAGASAGLRSLTDRFVLNRLAANPQHLDELVTDSFPPDIADPAPATPPLDPAPATPEQRVAPIPPTTRKEPPNVAADLTPEERVSRIEELRSSIERVVDSYTGVLPDDVEVSYQKDKQELASLETAEAAYQSRQADKRHVVETRGGKPEGREVLWGANPPNIVKKPENIYGGAAIADIETRGRSTEERNALRRDFAMRSLEAEKSFPPMADKPRTQDRIDYLLDSVDEPTPGNPDRELSRRIILGGDPVYKRAYNKLLANGGNVSMLTPEEQRGTALAMTVTTTGGFLVPYAWDPTVIAVGVHNVINPYRQVCRVIDVVGANIWHGLTSTAVTAVRGTEALVAAEAGPTFAQPAFTPSRVETQVTYSYEVAQDRANLGEELAVLIQEAKDNEEEATFTLGANTTTTVGVVGMVPPKGTAGAYTLVETAANSAITEADLNKIELALPVRFRKNAAWFLGRKTIRYIQALETAYGTVFNAAGNFPNPVGYPAVGNPETNWGNTGLKIKGYPVYESVSIPTTIGTQNPLGAFCDPSTFYIVDRVGMDIEFIPNVFSASQGWMATGQRAIYAMWRNAAGPVTILGGLFICNVT